MMALMKRMQREIIEVCFKRINKKAKSSLKIEYVEKVVK